MGIWVLLKNKLELINNNLDYFYFTYINYVFIIIFLFYYKQLKIFNFLNNDKSIFP